MTTSNNTQNSAAGDLSPHRLSDDDVEFEFAVEDDSTADENSATNTFYPIFGRERSSVDDLVQPHSYCALGPSSLPASPDRPCKKSSSTGSASRWRLRDLVVGRSHSDGKDKFVFLAPPAGKKSRTLTTSEAPPAVKGSKGKVTEMDMATAHRLYYSKGNSSAAAGVGAGGRRSFLPYKQDLVGFLGLSRSHPF